jgi:hypothetical protein
LEEKIIYKADANSTDRYIWMWPDRS